MDISNFVDFIGENMKRINISLSILGSIAIANSIMANNQTYFIQLKTADSGLLYDNLAVSPKTEWRQEILGGKTVEIAVHTKDVESTDGMFQISCQIEQYPGFIANTQKCTIRFVSAHTESSNKLNESFVSEGYIISEFNEPKDISQFYKPYMPVIFTSLERVTLKHNGQYVQVPRFNFFCKQDEKFKPTACIATGVIS